MNLKRVTYLFCGLIFLQACSQPGGAPAFLETEPNTGSQSSGRTPSTNSNSYNSPHAAQKMIYHVEPADVAETKEADALPTKTFKFQVSQPVWLIGFKPEVLDSDGNPLPGELLHKALLINKHESNPVCSSSNQGNPFAVATSALTPVELPEGYGYPLLPEDPLEAKVIFQNNTGKDYSNVVFSFELTTLPMEKVQGYSDMDAIYLDNDPCEHKALAIEPGAFVEQSKTFNLSKGGQLMVANGILSDYGVSVSLTHQPEGSPTLVPFWRAEAQLDKTHKIVDLTPNPFIDLEGRSIKRGDKITLGVTFDNFSNRWHNNATGGAIIYMVPEEVRE